MAKPLSTTSTQQKIDHSKKKNHRSHEEWSLGKKIGRAKQVWVDTSMGMSIEDIERLTDGQILALPKPHWEKVSA